MDPGEKELFLNGGGEELEAPAKSMLTPYRILQAVRVIVLLGGYLAIGKPKGQGGQVRGQAGARDCTCAEATGPDGPQGGW